MKPALLLLVAILISASPSFAETIRIGGSGSMIPLLTDLGKAYVKKYPKDEVDVRQTSMGQPGGIAALNAGAVDIAMSATDLSEEQLKLQIRPVLIAKVAGAVAVNAGVTVKGITNRQLCDIYAGKITSWKELGGADAKIIAYTRPESDSTKQSFRKGFACMANLIESPDIPNLPKTQDMETALSTKPNSVGPLDIISVNRSHGKFRPLLIDGKGPNDLAKGGWPFVLHNNLVTGKNRSDGVTRFLGYIKSPEGQAIIKKHGALPTPFTL